MSFRTALLALERRFAWGVIGFVTGTLIGIAGLYYALKERAPNVLFEIIGEFNVLDVRQPLPDLAISFQGQDIQRGNLNLRILRVRIVNEGDADVLQGHFDQGSSWGITTSAARFLEVRLVDASSPYLEARAQPRLVSDSVIQFPNVILERGQFFTVELLLLHSKDSEPSLGATGKIAGVDSIRIVDRSQQAASRSTWQAATRGSLWTQIVRLLLYFVGGLVLVVSIGLLVGGTAALFSTIIQRRRGREIKLILETTSPEEVVAKGVLIEIYTQFDLRGLQRIEETITAPFLRRSARLWGGRDEEELDWGGRREEAMAVGLPFARHGGFSSFAMKVGGIYLATELARRLGKKRLLGVSGSDEPVHPAFTKLLRTAIQRLGAPSKETE